MNIRNENQNLEKEIPNPAVYSECSVLINSVIMERKREFVFQPSWNWPDEFLENEGKVQKKSRNELRNGKVFHHAFGQER